MSAAAVFLTPGELAARWRLSRAQTYELTRLNRVPLVQTPGRRSVLIPVDQLEAYEAGAVELEVVETRNALGRGRVVRPVEFESNGRHAASRRERQAPRQPQRSAR